MDEKEKEKKDDDSCMNTILDAGIISLRSLK
jgi:hypothetical protein